MPTRGQYDVRRVTKADSTLLPGIAFKEVIGAIDILQVKGKATPLYKRCSTFMDCDFRLYFLSASEQRYLVIKNSVPLSREAGSSMIQMGYLPILLGTTTISSPSLLDASFFTSFYTYFVLLISTVRPVLLMSSVPPRTTCMASYFWLMILMVMRFSVWSILQLRSMKLRFIYYGVVGSLENFQKRCLHSFSAECMNEIVFYSGVLCFIPSWELLGCLGSLGEGLKLGFWGLDMPGLLTHSPI